MSFQEDAQTSPKKSNKLIKETFRPKNDEKMKISSKTFSDPDFLVSEKKTLNCILFIYVFIYFLKRRRMLCRNIFNNCNYGGQQNVLLSISKIDVNSFWNILPKDFWPIYFEAIELSKISNLWSER